MTNNSIKKLALNKQTLRVLASSDPFETIATHLTPRIAGGCQQGPSGQVGCSVALACPDGVKG